MRQSKWKSGKNFWHNVGKCLLTFFLSKISWKLGMGVSMTCLVVCIFSWKQWQSRNRLGKNTERCGKCFCSLKEMSSCTVMSFVLFLLCTSEVWNPLKVWISFVLFWISIAMCWGFKNWDDVHCFLCKVSRCKLLQVFYCFKG